MITLPQSLIAALANIQPAKNAAMELRQNYIAQKSHGALRDVYLTSRFPATYAAILSVLQRLPINADIKTALDIGCGPGVGLWALRARFQNLIQYSGFDADAAFLQMARELNADAPQPAVSWLLGVYPQALPEHVFDLVLASYTFNENAWGDVAKTLKAVWEKNVGAYLVLLEPGTPKGFARILEMRNYVISLGGFVYAPCMGNYTCPMKQDDWCHFSVRLAREQFQTHVKDSTLPYEDEKYSYLIVSKTPKQHVNLENASRVIKKPIKRSGHYVLDVCGQNGETRLIVSKSNKEKYKEIKQTDWGDLV